MESPRIIRLNELRTLTGLPASTIYRMMREGTFPQHLKLSKRAVGWRESEVLTWIAARQAA